MARRHLDEDQYFPEAQKKQRGMSLKIMFKSVAALAVLASAPVMADDGDDYKFVLVNKSGTSIVSFQANAGKAWSKNWLVGSIKPAQSKPLRFSPDATESCSVTVRVLFEDDSKYEDDVDFCKVTNLVVDDKTMWTE